MIANEVKKEWTVFADKLIVQRAEINDDDETYTKFRIKREDAAAVLILNIDSDKVILTKQFRYPIADKINENILEIVAGKVDEGEVPVQTAIRECEEEVGYRIKMTNIRLLFSCFSSPGYSSERFFIYFATVGNEDKVSGGGGVEDENVSVVEMESEEFYERIRNGYMDDAKTYLAGLFMLLNKFKDEANMDRSDRVWTSKHSG